MTPAEPHDRRACPVCVADAARLLLRTGRPGMALSVLDGLPGLIEDALTRAWMDGVEQGRAAAREALAARAAVPVAAGMKGTGPRPWRRSPALPSAPAFARAAEELREHVGRLGAERVAELLMVRLDDLGPLLEGRVGVARSAMAKLRRAA